MAIPFLAVKLVEKVDLELKLNKGDKKGQEFASHTFEILLKDDFLDFFLRSDYEQLFSPVSTRKNK